VHFKDAVGGLFQLKTLSLFFFFNYFESNIFLHQTPDHFLCFIFLYLL